MTLRRRCLCGCGQLVTGTRCKASAKAQRDPRYSTARWKELRKAVRARDNGLCQLRLPGCRIAAGAVDHITEPGPYELGRHDLFFAIGNLQASCVSCNVAKRNRRQSELARQAITGTRTELRKW